MKLRYNYRIEPDGEQVRALSRVFGCTRVVYNDGLAARRDAHKRGLPYITDNQLSKLVITQAKKTPEREWLGEVSAVALQQALGDLNAAYRNFFQSLTGQRKGRKHAPPRRRKKTARQSARFVRSGFSLRPNGSLYIARVGSIKVRWSRALPSEPSSVVIIREADGRYYASFVVDIDQAPLPETDHEVGIDLGLSHYAVDSDGRVIDSPKFLRQAERKFRRAAKAVSRKQSGSKNRAKAQTKLARAHTKIRNQRRDFIHQTTTRIVRENQAVYLEDLAVGALSTRKGRKGKSFADQALGQFANTLEAKCNRYGRHFAKVDRFFPSTQLCSACGSIEGPKGQAQLYVREWTCSCGTTHNRDHNAAKNILAAGQAERLNDCGAQVRPPVAVAQRCETVTH